MKPAKPSAEVVKPSAFNSKLICIFSVGWFKIFQLQQSFFVTLFCGSSSNIFK